MKLIIAVIQPEELPDIKEELLKRKIYKFTISNVLGQGMEFPIHEVYRGIAHEIKNYLIDNNQYNYYRYIKSLSSKLLYYYTKY